VAAMKKAYQNEKICVYWEPAKCIHSANCVRGLPAVFNTRRRPWIDISAADAEEIMRCIDHCPSGALSYHKLATAETKPKSSQA
jgi:uncharacterized Fe-S cluster protein YjdI